MTDVDPREMRAALESLPHDTSYGEPTPVGQVYFPQSHLKALHPDVALVKGMRGAGKTFWWSALQDRQVRQLIGESHERTGIDHRTDLRTGFGVRPALDDYPSKDVLGHLLQQVDARTTWRAVQAWHLAPHGHPLRQNEDWVSRVNYVQGNPESIDRMLSELDQELVQSDRRVLVIYDALDRSADDWRSMYSIIRGLIQTALDMRSYRRIRVKIFLRTDQFERAQIGNFPDASKVFSSAIELSWPRQELYGLLWHLLAEASPSGSDIVRSGSEGEQRNLFMDGAARNSPAIYLDETRQRRAFQAIAGEWMGRGPKRGVPYTWIPNHLSDTEGKVSPRSFIAALRAAATDTRERHPQHEYALHYESINRGVQKASEFRVAELGEDYPWVGQLLGDLKGMTVPCDFHGIKARWQENGTLSRLRSAVAKENVRLPPSRIEDGPDGVRADLESLNVFHRMHDGRVNIPDVFRVGYGLGRRGGVQPVR